MEVGRVLYQQRLIPGIEKPGLFNRLLGQIPPPCAGLEHPEDAFEGISVGAARTSEGVGVRKQGTDPLPDRFGP